MQKININLEHYSQSFTDVLRILATRDSPISVHGIRACMPLSRIPTLVTQCRQHMGLNVVPCNGVHEARLRDDGMRIRRHSHEPRGYGTESVDIHPSLLEGMDTLSLETRFLCRPPRGCDNSCTIFRSLSLFEPTRSRTQCRCSPRHAVVDDNRLLQH